MINGPKCCKERMARWMYVDDNDMPREFWQCQTCGKQKALYRWPWKWLWIRVNRNDLPNGNFKPIWWLGNVRGLVGIYDGTLLFTVIPFNRIVNFLVSIYYWFRYCPNNKWKDELEKEYLRGEVVGEKRELIRRKVIIGELHNVIKDETDLETVLRATYSAIDKLW